MSKMDLLKKFFSDTICDVIPVLYTLEIVSLECLHRSGEYHGEVLSSKRFRNSVQVHSLDYYVCLLSTGTVVGMSR
jgi:hypothetical protein